MRKARILVGLLLATTAIAASAQGVIHGSGDPRTMNPGPNCGQSRFYVDDSTSQLYIANSGSPCVWSAPGTGNVASSLVSGYSAYLPFIEGTGTVANDFSGHGNNCTFAAGGSAPSWTLAGTKVIGMKLGDFVANTIASCSFPPSTSLTDTNILNARTITFCGYVQPHYNVNGTFNYSVLFAESVANRAQGLAFASPGPVGSIAQRTQGYPEVVYGSNQAGTTGSSSINGWGCVTWALGSTSDSTVDHIYINATEITPYGTNTGNFWPSRVAGDYFTLGQALYNSSFLFNGVATTILAYPTQLTAAQVAYNNAKLQASALTDRGVSNQFSVNASNVNQLVINGDSFAQPNPGPGFVNTFPSLISTTQTFALTQLTKGGQVQMNAAAGAPVVDTTYYAPAATYNIAMSENCINDLLGINGAASFCHQFRNAYGNTMLNAGFTVLIPTLVDNSAVRAAIQAYDELARQWTEKTPNTYIVDWANEPCLGATNAITNPGALACFTQETGAAASVTNCSLTTNVATFTAVNTFASGDSVWLSNLTGNCSALNSLATVQVVLASGLSGTGFSVNFTHANITSVATTGTAGTVFQADLLHPSQIGMNELARLTSNVINYVTGATQTSPSTSSATTYTLAAADRFLNVTPASTMTITLPACYGWGTTEPFTIQNQTAAVAVNVSPAAGFTLNGSSSAVSVPVAFGKLVIYANRLSTSTSGCGWFTK